MITIKQICSNSLSLEPLIIEFNKEKICVVTIGGDREPCPDNRVHGFKSKDGISWEHIGMIYTNERACYANAMNVIDNKIYLHLIVHDGDFWNMKTVTLCSQDGKKWKEIPTFKGLEEWTLIRPMTKLSYDTIIIPYHSYPIQNNERICRQGVLITKDNGKTYENHICFDLKQPLGHLSMSKETIDGTLGWIWTEPSIAELSDGALVMFIRVDNTGWIWKSISKDRGVTWSQPVKTDIPNSTCKSQLIKCGNKIAFINVPNNKEIIEKGAFYAYRWPLEIWVSKDDLKTWNKKIQVTDFPGEYHYPNGYYKNNKLSFVIEHNRHSVLYIETEI